MPDNPNPPSPERLALEAAILPKINAISGAILRWRAGIRGEDQMPPAIPYQGGLMGAGVNGAKVPNPQPRMPPPPETGAAYGNPIQQALMAQQREGRQDPLADYPKSWPEYGEKFAKNMEEKNAMDWAGGFGPGSVKMKGGMWHPQATDQLAAPLYHNLVPDARGPGYADMRAAERVGPEMHPYPEELVRDKPAFDWTNKAVRNYLNKHAGTAEDPLNNIEIPYGAGTKRWESVTDDLIHSRAARTYEPHPQLAKTPPEEQVWKMETDPSLGVGRRYNVWLKENNFPRLSMDELRGDVKLNPAQETRLREFEDQWREANAATQPMQQYMSHVGDYMRNIPAAELPRYDLVRAVRETAAQDAARAKKMNSVEARSEGTIVHKEYPDKFKWVEVGKSDAPLPPGSKVYQSPQGYWFLENPDKTANHLGDHFKTQADAEAAARTFANREINKKALENEGNTMGHCVGGYCDYVESGHSKIYSLRDPKGGSHVTIEVRPPDPRLVENSPDNLKNHPKFSQEWAAIDEGGTRTGTIRYQAWQRKVAQSPEFAEWMRTRPSDIAQIKGKQNLSPSDEYLPYVQDFIKSGKWDHVGDLEHTGMVQHEGRFLTHKEAIPEGIANIKKALGEDKLFRRGSASDSAYRDQLTRNLRDLEAAHGGKEVVGGWKSALYFALDLARKQ